MSIAEHMFRGVPLLSSRLLRETGGIAHGFSTRQGGVSKAPFDSLNLGCSRGDDPVCVEENYRRFCAAIGADHTCVVKSRQVHGDDIRCVTAADSGVSDCAADGMVTDVPGLCLTVFTADCVPVLLYDPRRRCVAAVHSGWRGTALSIAAKAVERMVKRYGCRAEDILAAVGPSIGSCCFETRADVSDAMTAAFGSRAGVHIQRTGGETFRVDLKGLIADGLKEAGILSEHLEISDLCTACRRDLFWSHRLTGNARGSMAAMIQLL